LRKAGFLSLALARFAHGRDYSELVILRQEGSSWVRQAKLARSSR
jgi:hypothetical protein